MYTSPVNNPIVIDTDSLERNNLRLSRLTAGVFKKQTKLFCEARKKMVYFAEKTNDSARENEKIHCKNRDNDQGNDNSRGWTFVDSIIETFRENKPAFLTGFVTAVILCYYTYYQPYSYGTTEPERELDLPMGYERTIKKQKEMRPDLFEA